MKTIFKTKHKTVVEPTRQIFIEEFLMPYLEIVDEWTGSKWSELEYEFESINIEDLIEYIDINSITTVNEGREITGKDKLDDERGNKLISEVTKNVQNQQNPA